MVESYMMGVVDVDSDKYRQSEYKAHLPSKCVTLKKETGYQWDECLTMF